MENAMNEPQTIQEKFALALSELIGQCEEAGMAPDEFVPALEKELRWARNPTGEQS